MNSRTLTASLALIAAALWIAPRTPAQVGLHPQSLGFNTAYVFDKDSVFSPVNEGKFRGMLQLNPATKAWKWVNDTDYPTGANGAILMRNRKEGVMVNVSGNSLFYTEDGWKTVALSTGATGINQVVLTETGYAGHSVQTKGMVWSSDGKAWTAASEPSSAGAGTGLLASHKDKVVIFSGSSFTLISNDGGKKYAIVDHDQSAFVGVGHKVDLAFRMFGPDSFLVINDKKAMTSVDGGKKWTAGNSLPLNSSRVLVRGWSEWIVMDNGGKIHHTADAGATWSAKDGPLNASSYGTLAWIGDALHLFPGYWTRDFGATWTPFFPAFMNGSGIGNCFAISFNGDFGALGFSTGKIAYTYDKGRSFTEIDTLPSKLDVMALKVLKNNRILASDRNGQVFISADTGRTWTGKLSSTFTQNGIKFSVSDDEKTMVLTRLGQPAGSGDDGAKWDFLPSAGGTLVQTVKPNGTIIGMANMEIATLYLDKPREKIDTLPFDQSPEDIVALTNDLGWIVTRVSGALIGEKESRLYKTTDGFKTFSAPVILDKTALGGNRILAVTPDVVAIYAEGRNYHLLSKDGGKTFARDSLTVHARWGTTTTWNAVRRIHYFNPGEQIYALTGNALYLNTGAPGSSAIRPDAQRPARQRFYAVFDAASGNVVLRGLGSQAATVGLYDVQGRKILARASRPESRTLPARNLPKGMYFVRATTADGRIHEARFLRH